MSIPFFLTSNVQGKVNMNNNIEKCTVDYEKVIVRDFEEKRQNYKGKKVSLKYIEENIKPFGFIFIDSKNKDRVIFDKDYGILIPNPFIIGTIKIDDTIFYEDFESILDLLKIKNLNVSLYQYGKKITSAKLIATPAKYKKMEKYSYSDFFLQLNSPNFDLKSGYYAVISNQWNAVSRKITFIEKSNDRLQFSVDLKGKGKKENFKIEKFVNQEYGGFSVGLNINGDCFSSNAIEEDQLLYVESLFSMPKLNVQDLENLGFWGIYDVDGDGELEIMNYGIGAGGESFSIDKYKNKKMYRQYWWISEEDLPSNSNPYSPYLIANQKNKT